MDGVVLDEIKTAVLDRLTGGLPVTGLVMGLFDTLTSISQSDVAATFFAHEAGFSGYARQALSGWGSSVLVGHQARSTAAPVTFSNSGLTDSTTLTGYFFYDATDSKMYLAGLFDTPFVIPAGASYNTTPFLSDCSCVISEP